jgi:hypothetical protein
MVVAGAIAAAPSHAALADWKGHLSLGYARVFVQDAPAGGFSMAAGVDYPITAGLRIGPDIGYHLLGTQSLTRGSLNANLDYSLFEVALRAHWHPMHAGPIHGISFGPALMGASAQVSSSSAGLAFEDKEVSELRPGAALDLALIPGRPSAVAVGIELGARAALLAHETWTVMTMRLVLRY